VKISILGSSKNDIRRDVLAKALAERLIAEGHEVFQGGITSGVMQAAFEGGAKGIIYCELKEKGIAQEDATDCSIDHPDYGDKDLGPDIRRGMLTRQVDVAIIFKGGIGTMDEIVGCLNAKTPIIFVGFWWVDFILRTQQYVGGRVNDHLHYVTVETRLVPDVIDDILNTLKKIEP